MTIKVNFKLSNDHKDNKLMYSKSDNNTINPKYNEDECFHYAVIVVLNHKYNKNNPEII